MIEEEKKRKVSNILRVIGTIVTIISVIVAVYIYRAKNNQKEFFEALLASKVIELIDANNEISKHRAMVESYKKLIENYQDSIAYKNLAMDSLYSEIEERNIFIYNLKNQLDESPVYLDVDDDEQFNIFLEWTRPN